MIDNFGIKYFTISEFTKSSTAEKNHIDNSIPNVLLENALYTLKRLDDIREKYGKPIIITSGYRCPSLNKLVGGVATSYHQKALAADLKWDAALYDFIAYNCKYDKLIFEKSKNSKWIHIQFNPDGERQQHFSLNA